LAFQKTQYADGKRYTKNQVITPQRYDLYQEDPEIQEKGNGIEG